MTRNARALLVVGIAVLTAGLASFGVYLAIRSQQPVVEAIPSDYVIVAAQPLELGVSLTSAHVRKVAWPARNPIAGSFSEIEKVTNRGLVVSVAENEPITESKLAPLGAGAGLSPAIPLKMRAMSVKVNEVIGVAGFVVPGTKVDVLVTIHSETDSATRIVVSNVQVLTAGTRYDEAQVKMEGKPIPSSVVTLLVSPPDAERIALAATEGQIMLALRNPLDTEPTVTPGIKASGLMLTGVVSAPPTRSSRPRAATVSAPPPPPPPLPPAPWVVDTIRAGKTQQETLR